jgi:hypothetical protein
MKSSDFTSLILKKSKPNILESQKNTHLEHPEDLVISHGYQGAVVATNILKDLISNTQNLKSITIKYDGSPAIITGKDPVTSNFFIGTKSVFNKKVSKICFSIEDIDQYYGDKPDLANKLKACFTVLKDANINQVLQGDLLYTEPTRAFINNKEYLTFKPNTLIYGIPAIENIPPIGIVFHTRYIGDSIATLTSAPLEQQITIPNVWSPNLTPTLNNVSTLLSGVDYIIQKINAHGSALDSLKDYSADIKRFVNQLVREGQYNIQPNEFINRFVTTQQKNILEDVDKLEGGISSTAAINRLEKSNLLESTLLNNPNALVALEIFNLISELKNKILTQVGSSDNVEVFKNNAGKIVPSKHEGIVATDKIGNSIKLVNRIEFSKLNFENNDQR